MKKNIGSIDRIVRIVVGALLAVLYVTGAISGTLGLVLLVFGGVFIATGFISFCGMYTLLGINTCKIKEEKK